MKWPICLSRRTGHARLVGAICTMGEDKEGGVCIDVDAPSSDTESAVKFTNARDCRDADSLCFFQLESRSSFLIVLFLFFCLGSYLNVHPTA